MAASPWISRFAAMVKPDAMVLDLACGAGRHGRLFLNENHHVVFVDRDVSGLNDLRDNPKADIRCLDLEDGREWPLGIDVFDAIIVTNYLYRPQLDDVARNLKGGAILLYETFAVGNERFGRPKNPDFLLQEGELLKLAQSHDLHVIAYEHGQDGEKIIQRICARKRNGQEVLAPL